LDSPPELVSLARGYLDHEAAHIRETDFDLVKASRLTPLEMHIWNMIEDWRIERVMSRHYPGCRENFVWLIKRFFDKDLPPGKPEEELLNWMLLTFRSWSVPELGVRVSELASRLNNLMPSLTDDLREVFDILKGDCLDTRDSIKFARLIVRVIGSFLNDSGKDQISSKSHDQDVNQPEPSGGVIDSASKGGSSISDSQSSASHTLGADISSALRSLLRKTHKELPKTFDSKIASSLTSAHSGSSADSLVVARIGCKSFPELAPDEWHKARSITLNLKCRLQNALQTMTLRNSKPGLRGKLDTNSLYKLSTCQPTVFRRTSVRTGLDTAVHLLIDVSGSMASVIDLTSMTAFSLCDALHGVPGVNVAATAFPGNSLPVLHHKQGWMDFPTVAPVLEHGQSVHRNFKFQAYGTTPLGESLWWVLQELSKLRESRKIIIIVTDGEPNSADNAKAALKAAEHIGVESYGLGLGNDSVMSLLPGRSTVITNLADLPGKLFWLLEQAMKTQLRGI
jgi:hypothetical protein